MNDNELNPEVFALDWESNGESTIQMLAWNATRLVQPQNGIPQKIFFAIVLAVLLAAAVAVVVTSVPDQDFVMTFIGLGGIYFIYWAFRSIFRSKASVMRWYMDYYTQAVERGDVESTEGKWSCLIDHECVKYEHIDRKRITIFPLSDISSVVRVHDRIGLLNGNILLGHMPDEIYNGVELFELILQRVRSQNSEATGIREAEQW